MQSTINVLRHFGESLNNQSGSAIKRIAEEQLPRSLVKAWLELIDEDHNRNPFKDNELETLVSRESATMADTIKATPALAYGSTLPCGICQS